MSAKSHVQKVIMIVDDEMSVLDLLKSIFEGEGYAVSLAVSGEQGLRKLEDIKPHLLILDMMMPGLSGIEVCQRVRATPEWNDIRVMFLTVMRKTKDVEDQLKQLDVVDYIQKPFMVDELVKRVKIAIS